MHSVLHILHTLVPSGLDCIDRPQHPFSMFLWPPCRPNQSRKVLDGTHILLLWGFQILDAIVLIHKVSFSTLQISRYTYFLNYLCQTRSHRRHRSDSSISLFPKSLTLPEVWCEQLVRLTLQRFSFWTAAWFGSVRYQAKDPNCIVSASLLPWQHINPLFLCRVRTGPLFKLSSSFSFASD